MIFPIFVFAFSGNAYVRTMTDFSKLIQILLKAIESSDPGKGKAKTGKIIKPAAKGSFKNKTAKRAPKKSGCQVFKMSLLRNRAQVI